MSSSISSPATRIERLMTMPPKGEERDFGCSAANVYYHAAPCFQHRQVGADRSRHRLFN